MALEIGLVRVERLEQPEEPVYSFLEDLVRNVDWLNMGEEKEGNAYLETERDKLLSRARDYSKEHALTAEEAATLEAWVASLPWQDNTIMLHFNW